MTQTDSKTGNSTYHYRRDVVLDMKTRKEKFGTPFSISMVDHEISRKTFNRWEKEVEAKEKGADRSTGLTPSIIANPQERGRDEQSHSTRSSQPHTGA